MMVAGAVAGVAEDEGAGARAAGRTLAQDPSVIANATTALARATIGASRAAATKTGIRE
jgi:hypothetical protein